MWALTTHMTQGVQKVTTYFEASNVEQFFCDVKLMTNAEKGDT